MFAFLFVMFRGVGVLLGVLLIVLASCYLGFLLFVYPELVPYHGGGERFYVSEDGVFTLGWRPQSRCRVVVSAESPVDVYLDGVFVGHGVEVEVPMGAGYHEITVSSAVPVSGMMTARQEPPVEKVCIASTAIAVGAAIVLASLLLSKIKGG